VAVEKSTTAAANELRKSGDLLTGEFKWIGKTILEILSGLEFIHKLHEIYRDLKPENSLCHQLLRLTMMKKQQRQCQMSEQSEDCEELEDAGRCQQN
jgi:hypothetical protein